MTFPVYRGHWEIDYKICRNCGERVHDKADAVEICPCCGLDNEDLFNIVWTIYGEEIDATA